MKTTFFKNMLPVAVIALGITGAFASNVVHSSSKNLAAQNGYTLNSLGKCNVKVACSDIPNAVCRLNGGAQAFAMDENDNCNQITYQP